MPPKDSHALVLAKQRTRINFQTLVWFGYCSHSSDLTHSNTRMVEEQLSRAHIERSGNALLQSGTFMKLNVILDHFSLADTSFSIFQMPLIRYVIVYYSINSTNFTLNRNFLSGLNVFWLTTRSSL